MKCPTPPALGAAVVSLAALLAAPALAADLPPPGAYTLSDGRVSPQVQSWGEHCGPTPTTATRPGGGRYQLTAEGVLAPEGRARPLFEPGVCKATTGVANQAERRQGQNFRCSTPKGAAKQANGTIRLSRPSVDALTVTMRIAYEWRLKGDLCKASIDETFRLKRVDPLPVAAAEPAPAPPPDRCATPGPAAVLEASGSLGRAVRAGGRVRLGVRALDAAGCVTNATIKWTASAGSVSAGGVWNGASVEPGARAAVTAAAGSARLTFKIRVARSEAELDALIASNPDLAVGEMAPLPAQEGMGLGASRAQTEADAQRKRARLLTVGLGALGIIALGLLAWLGWRSVTARRRSRVLDPEARAAILEKVAGMQPSGGGERPVGTDRREASGGHTPATPGSGAGGGGLATAGPGTVASRPPGASQPARGAAQRDRVCPRCDRRYDHATSFCPHDGERLEYAAGPLEAIPAQQTRPGWTCARCGTRHAASVSHCNRDGAPRPGSASPDGPSRICPKCGARHGSEATHCTRDGSELVLLN